MTQGKYAKRGGRARWPSTVAECDDQHDRKPSTCRGTPLFLQGNFLELGGECRCFFRVTFQQI